MMLKMSRWIKGKGLPDREPHPLRAFFVGMIICGVQVYNGDQA
jgi:hypothetical protein